MTNVNMRQRKNSRHLDFAFSFFFSFCFYHLQAIRRLALQPMETHDRDMLDTERSPFHPGSLDVFQL